MLSAAMRGLHLERIVEDLNIPYTIFDELLALKEDKEKSLSENINLFVKQYQLYLQ